jgi:hypothetical protein
VVLVVAVLVGDQVALARTRSTIESRIEQRVPGSHASVSISSSPFLVRLALSGTVREIHAHVTNVKDGSLTFDTVDVVVHDLKVDRSSLLNGPIRLTGLSSATITATASVSEVLQAAGYGSFSGLGALASGLSGTVTTGSGQVKVTFGPISFAFTYSALVPCVGSARVTGSEVELTCTTTTLPPALQTT